MRGLNLDADAASQEADEKYYLKHMKEIVEDFPNKGPPMLSTRLAGHLYIGSLRNADDIPHLQRLGITHVLNCAGTRRFDVHKNPYPRESGIKGYLIIPAEDHDDFNIRSYFHDAISFLDKAKHSNGRALVHCNLGVNRSGAICAAYLMIDQHMTLLECIRYLKTKRSVVLWNKGFRYQLYRFARCKGLLDPILRSAYESNPGSSRSSTAYVSSSSRQSSSSSSSSRSRTPVYMGGSVDSATIGASYQPTFTRPRKFASRFFKRYGRSLSNSVVEEEIARHKPKSSTGDPTSGSIGARSKDEEPSESRFAKSFLTLPRRQASGPNKNNNNNKTLPSKQMDTLPENVPVENFKDELSAARKRGAYRKMHAEGNVDAGEDKPVQASEDSGFSTLPGAKLRAAKTVDKTDSNEVDDLPGSPKSLSTSRPLRVYRRSATDSEVYRSRRQASAKEGAERPKTPRSPGSENNLDKISKDMTAFTFEPLPMTARTASTPEHGSWDPEDAQPNVNFARKISAN